MTHPIAQTHTYTPCPVDLGPLARYFPQTNVDSSTMVHLWPKVSFAVWQYHSITV